SRQIVIAPDMPAARARLRPPRAALAADLGLRSLGAIARAPGAMRAARRAAFRCVALARVARCRSRARLRPPRAALAADLGLRSLGAIARALGAMRAARRAALRCVALARVTRCRSRRWRRFGCALRRGRMLDQRRDEIGAGLR